MIPEPFSLRTVDFFTPLCYTVYILIIPLIYKMSSDLSSSLDREHMLAIGPIRH